MSTEQYISIRESKNSITDEKQPITQKEDFITKNQNESYGIDMSLNKIQKLLFRCLIIIILLILTTIAILFLTGIIGYTCYFCISCYQSYTGDYLYNHLEERVEECNNKFLLNEPMNE